MNLSVTCGETSPDRRSGCEPERSKNPLYQTMAQGVVLRFCFSRSAFYSTLII